MKHHNEQHQQGQPCPYLETCSLICNHRDKLPGLIDRFMARYCYKNHQACSRRWIREFLGAEKVPDLMMPQQRDWAEQLLFEAGIRYRSFQEKFGSF